DGLPGLERATLLGVVDDRKREAILHRRHRIEGLALDVHRHVVGCDVVDADDGCVADRAENAVMDHDIARFRRGRCWNVPRSVRDAKATLGSRHKPLPDLRDPPYSTLKPPCEWCVAPDCGIVT